MTTPEPAAPPHNDIDAGNTQAPNPGHTLAPDQTPASLSRDARPHTGARVTVTRLAKTYQLGPDVSLKAVDDVTLTFEPASIVALTGPSGSGKSTLLHLIGAIDRPDSGTITVDDLTLTDLSRMELARYRRTIGFVFQRYNLLPALSAIDNVLAAVLPYKTDFDKADRARELLAQVGLAGRETSLPSRLSGGQQQRVAIARALISRPRLILADEPTGNLDSATGSDILQLLLTLRETRGVTILLATHDPTIAARCDTTITMRDGRTTPCRPAAK